MQKKTVLIVLMLVVMLAASVFLIRRQSTDSRLPTIAFVVPTLANPFFVQMKEGAEAEIDSATATVLFQAPAGGVEDQAAQSDLVETLVARGVSAVCLVPADSSAVVSAVETANSAGVPVINVDNRINDEAAAERGVSVPVYIGSDNTLGGQLAGEYIVERLGGQGGVILLEGLVGSDAAIQRANGFLAAIDGASEITLLARESASWSREQALDKFGSMLLANPNADAVFAANDEMALGAAAALAATGSDAQRGRIFIIGFDATPDGLQAVQDGRLAGTIAQQPVEMGRTCVSAALDLISGKSVAAEIATAVTLVTQ